MKHGVLTFFCVSVLANGCGASGGIEQTDRDDTAYVRIPKTAITEQFISATGFNRDHKQDDVFTFGYMHRDQLEGLPPSMHQNIVELDERFARMDFDAKTLSFDPADLKSLDEMKEGYHDYTALTDELERLADLYPELTELTSAGTSVHGRELWVMKISDNAELDEDEPKLLYIANMHGDEVVGRELMIYLIRQLLEEYGTNDRITTLVDNAQIYIMPSMNPDGFERGRRANANGSDLNRNFPDFIADPRDTPAGRQQETKAVMQFHQDHHFVQAINFHGGAVCFNLPWDTQPNRTEEQRFEEDPLLAVLGREYADTNTHMSTQGGFDRGVTYGYEWYRVTGGMQDWANYYRRSIHATVELSFSKWPGSNTLDTHWSRHQESLLLYLERGLNGAHLKVVNTYGELINNVAVNVASTGRRTVRYDHGIIHKPTLPGRQTITLSAPGYVASTFDIDATMFDGHLQDVVLEPSGTLVR